MEKIYQITAVVPRHNFIARFNGVGADSKAAAMSIRESLAHELKRELNGVSWRGTLEVDRNHKRVNNIPFQLDIFGDFYNESELRFTH